MQKKYWDKRNRNGSEKIKLEEPKRESFGSRIGFILVSAGCAIGIGNVWKFPYVAGQNGGAIFVLFYLFFLAIMGIPMLTAELAIGRASRKTVVEAYRSLEKEGQKWHIHGWICVMGNYLLMMYYTTVAGWMIAFFWKFLTGEFDGISNDQASGVFDNMLKDPVQMTVFMAIVVIVGFIVLNFGVRNGLERVNTYMMTGLLALIIVLAVNSIMLPGGSEGLKFYLMPNIDNARKVGWINVITSAMNQAFFTLSIGMASMEVFGSYMSKEHALTGESIRICLLDTLVAIVSGLIIFPACFSYNVEAGAGPSLIFITLPNVFINMPAGRFWGALFFMFMTFASFSTVTAVFENIISFAIDTLKQDRKKAVFINCIAMLILSMPCVLGLNILSDVSLIGGRNIMDTEDFLVNNLILPCGTFIFLIFCVTRFGWGAENYLKEVNTGKGIKLSPVIIGYMKYVLPILIFVILISGLVN
ncbi:MAG: sodium-dependent transporter [Lachnospiraceae bacterium]|nr:sodium-dependent transporter [Lachnospiraceae bacterium]